jgi:hypothetical protein
MESFVVVFVVAILAGIAGYLIVAMVRSIRKEQRSSGVRRLWPNFGLSLVFCGLFLLSWAGQGFAEWQLYRSEQRAHGEAVRVEGYLVEFGQSTLENWQSEFLQLFSFVVLSAVLIHRGSAESKDSDDRIEAAIERIEKRLDDLSRSEA